MALLRHLRKRSVGESPGTSKQTAPAPALCKVTESDEAEGSVFYRTVMAMDSSLEEARHGETIHASSLPGMCVRRHVLSNLHGSPSSRTVYAGERIVWALGRAAEAHVRSQYISATKGKGVFGIWSCRCGATRHRGEYDEAVICTVCKYSAMLYGEFTLTDATRNVMGNPDLVHRLPNGLLRVIEIKSIKKDSFEELSGPTEDHKVQAAMYRRLLMHEFPERVDKKVAVFYVCKDFSFRPYKEYLFDVDADDTVSSTVDRLLSKAAHASKALTDARSGLGLPGRIAACPNTKSTIAKACPVCSLCFAV